MSSSIAFSAPPKPLTNSTTVQNQISVTKAVDIAKSKAQGIVKSVDYDHDDYEYEVELISNTMEYEFEIDSRTGEIIEFKKKKLSNNDVRKYNALRSAKISLTQAMQIANRSVSGQVTEAEFDTEDGTPVFEVKVINSGQKYKVYVDTTTGKVIKTKKS